MEMTMDNFIAWRRQTFEINKLKNEVEELRKYLKIAVDEADGWYDNDTGGGLIKTPEMKVARKLCAS